MAPNLTGYAPRAPSDRLVAVEPAPETASQKIEIELVSERGAGSTGDDDTNRIETALAGERGRHQVGDFTFQHGCGQDTEIDE
jgi:hypothetical protein